MSGDVMDEQERKLYRKFRTGYTYREVAAMVWSYDDDPRTWLPASEKTITGPDGKKKWKRRRLILGKWTEIKREMWARVLHECGGLAGYIDYLEKLKKKGGQDLDPVPF